MHPSRNASCPCGSGRKFKHCHGALPSAPGPGHPANAARAARLAAATGALQEGNLALADLMCREVLAQDPGDPTALMLLGNVASQARRFDCAVQYFTRVLRGAPDRPDVASALDEARAALRQQQGRTAPAPQSKSGVLLIKAWGYGFWSDVDHVAGQLLVADLTNRIPIVRWGKNSLFGALQVDNAFDLYFHPVSPHPLEDLVGPDASFFPPKWNHGNLAAEDVNKWAGPGSRLTGLYFFNREETVVVSDFHTHVNDLIPWIDPGSRYFGLSRDAIYRQLFSRHLELRPYLQARIDRFWQTRMAGREWLAVHVRGSDKVHEVGHLAAINASYFARVDELIGARPELWIYLLTDSEQVLRDFQHRYGSRLLHSACTRSATTTGVHYAGHPGQRIAEEVILDTCLAARCDVFLGNGASNVSTTVRHLKDWAAGTYSLIGEDFLSVRNIFLHQR